LVVFDNLILQLFQIELLPFSFLLGDSWLPSQITRISPHTDFVIIGGSDLGYERALPFWKVEIKTFPSCISSFLEVT
ncbi:hypothetical protein CLOM_g14403, partial [Closterium sp. NIES-68]